MLFRVIIVPTNLATNQLLSLFGPFLYIKKKNQIFSKLIVWCRKMFLFFFFVTSLALVQMSFPIQKSFFIKEFCYMLLLFVLQFHAVKYERELSVEWFLQNLDWYDCLFLSCHVRVSLQLPECQGTPCSKQARYLKFK